VSHPEWHGVVRDTIASTLVSDGDGRLCRAETLARILRDAECDPDRPTWRAKVRALLVLDERPMRKAQVAAIRGIEKSLAEQRFDRLLVQMVTGAGDRVRILRLISGQSGCLPDRRSAVRTRLVPAG
jgi:hypothetical protein